MSLTIRTLTTDDIPYALDLAVREGWDTTADVFEAVLEHDPDGCFVAERDGHRVGMITTTRHDCTAWVGNLIVKPELRRQGVGAELMAHAMTSLSMHGIRTIRLEADSPGVRLYRRLGFVDEFESFRFRSNNRGEVETGGAEPMPSDVLGQVTSFDAGVFGDDRGWFLRFFYARAIAAYWMRDAGRVRGYAMVVPSAFGVRFGPCAALDRATGNALLRTALADLRGRAVLLGVPALNRQAADCLAELGFEQTPSCLRMIHGEPDGVGSPEHIYAIGNGAMG